METFLSFVEGTFLFLPPSRYVFQGAEVYDEDDSDEDNMSQKDDSSSSCSSDVEELPSNQEPATTISQLEEDEKSKSSKDIEELGQTGNSKDILTPEDIFDLNS